MNASSKRQESIKSSSLKNCSDLFSLTYAGYYFVRLVFLLNSSLCKLDLSAFSIKLKL